MWIDHFAGHFLRISTEKRIWSLCVAFCCAKLRSSRSVFFSFSIRWFATWFIYYFVAVAVFSWFFFQLLLYGLNHWCKPFCERYWCERSCSRSNFLFGRKWDEKWLNCYFYCIHTAFDSPCFVANQWYAIFTINSEQLWDNGSNSNILGIIGQNQVNSYYFFLFIYFVLNSDFDAVSMLQFYRSRHLNWSTTIAILATISEHHPLYVCVQFTNDCKFI